MKVHPFQLIGFKHQPAHPYTLAALHAHTAPKKVDVTEIHAIERFYERLCHLVERQRVSDPLSISIVHKVRRCRLTSA